MTLVIPSTTDHCKYMVITIDLLASTESDNANHVLRKIREIENSIFLKVNI